MEINIKNLKSLPDAAEEFVKHIQGHDVIAFYGQMGAGKTTFIKAVCRTLGVVDQINSPTFAIVNEYHDETDCVIYHFDFYRIKNLEEVYDFGYEDYFYSGNRCLVEWPELIEAILPEAVLKVTITVNEDESRTISYNP